MSADYSVKAGDTEPAFAQQLNYSDGSAVDLTGASVKLLMRSLSSTQPATLTGSTVVKSPASSGIVVYTPSAADTSAPGSYIANWVVVFGGGQTMSFPTDGYLSIEIEESLAATGTRQLVLLPELKEHLGIDSSDRKLDAKLQRAIEAIRPLIERITGPLIPTVYDEKYAGGNSFISLSHRPSVGYGTTPILNVMAVSEYIGSTEYPLANVASAALGTIYSYEVNVRLGTITRRTAGGGTIGWPLGQNSVHVVYEAGQQTIPPNVVDAAKEAIRVNYQTEQATGRGRRTMTDELDTGPPLGFYLPRRVLELLGPTRKAPSIA